MKVFFSHCSEDKEIANGIVNLWKCPRFYSSLPDTGVDAGENLLDRINLEIKKCKTYIPIVTPSFLRSLYCMYELSVAVFLKKDIVPIATDAETYGKLANILGREILYINASKDDAAEVFAKRFSLQSCTESIKAVFGKLRMQNASTRPYIGMSASEYDKTIKYCQEQGVKRLQNTTMPAAEIKKRVSAANEVILVSTTGASVLNMLGKETLANALIAGCNIKIILPNQYSAFCADVAEIEQPQSVEKSIERLKNGFNDVITYMNESMTLAKQRCDTVGSVTMYCAYTLLRQTVLLVKMQESTWGWVSFTLPPARTADCTPSIEVECPNERYSPLMNALFDYSNGIAEIAQKRNAVKTIDGNSEATPFFLEKQHAENYWREKYSIAKENMQLCERNGSGILIEVAAQHPLVNGTVPSKEFSQRLDLAAELYKKYTEQNNRVQIYVPGSRHRYNGIADDVSLSSAGVKYLIEKGIPAADLWGENANLQFKGKDGVYNSADECFVAAQLFKQLNAKQLVCVCSPYQAHRKILHYFEFGVVPYCYCTSADAMFHNILTEVFQAIPDVLYVDHSCQNPESERFIQSRKERKVD